MTTQTSNYLAAMQALNDFYGMLYDAMQTALPGATISTIGAYGWRGYRIDKYENLATCQFYCQVYPHDPKTLLFKESYEYKGHYQNPFFQCVDLVGTNFFTKSREDQFAFVLDFVTNASKAAVKWMDSEDRSAKVPTEFQKGADLYHVNRGAIPLFNQVPSIYLEGFPTQDRLFGLLLQAIDRVSQQLYPQGIDLKPNAHWSQWHYRGWRMKVKGSSGKKPGGPTPRIWLIDFHNPSEIIYQMYDGKDYRVKNRFTLAPDFLADTEEHQNERLTEFVKHSLATV